MSFVTVILPSVRKKREQREKKKEKVTFFPDRGENKEKKPIWSFDFN